MVGDDEIRTSFKIEWVLQIVTIVFLIGVGWANISSIGALAEENKEKIEKEEETIQEIEKKLVAIEITQEDIKEDLEEQDKKLDKILEKLEEEEE
jgi:hypothetical protein